MEELRDGKWKTIAEAGEAYGVTPAGISYWMKRMGFEYLKGRIIYVKTASEVAEIKRLPDGVVKGGSSLLFRYGRYGSRYTRDIDTARVMELNSYLAQLNAALAQGWSGFAGKIVPVEPSQPAGVPSVYVMMPYDIKLNYCGRPWQTIRIEIGHNEIGDADEFESALPSESIYRSFATDHIRKEPNGPGKQHDEQYVNKQGKHHRHMNREQVFQRAEDNAACSDTDRGD